MEVNGLDITNSPDSCSNFAVVGLGVGVTYYFMPGNVFSMGDVGLRRAVNKLYNGGRKLSDRRTEELVVRWSPYRSVACSIARRPTI